MKLGKFLTTLSLVVAACAAISTPRDASAEDISVSVEGGSGDTVKVRIENELSLPMKVVVVRLGFTQNDGSKKYYFNTAGWTADLKPTGEDGDTWTGDIKFTDADGAPVPPDVKLADAETVSAGAGTDLASVIGPAEAALAQKNYVEIEGVLPQVRDLAGPIARANNFNPELVAKAGIPQAGWYDRERVDKLVLDLENALCENASVRLISTNGQSAREELYKELTTWLRERGLHINCINSEAKLIAARTLIASNRPQDALLFKEVDANGQLLPEWLPIYVEANLALAQTAADMNVTAFASIRPALEALNMVRELDPQNVRLKAVADVLIPNAAGWVISACDETMSDLPNAMLALQILRPTWSQYPKVEEAAAAFADALIKSGLNFCGRREYVNARNEFIRGERILDGVKAWEDKADEINHCRALGALDEGREKAALATDPNAPARGYEMIEEAQQRYTLTPAEIAAFKADIAEAWVGVANHQLSEKNEDIAFRALNSAEEMSPTGITDSMKLAWITYAEVYYSRYGFTIAKAQVEEVRAALAKADNVDPDRISSLEGKLKLAQYGLTVGGPLLLVLAGVIAFVLRAMNKAKGKKFAELADD